MDLEQHLKRQIAFSRGAFGPGHRTNGVIDHIRKELVEVSESNGSPDEWVDVVILALDGLTRSISRQIAITDDVATHACSMIVQKQNKNENRIWPDWRKADQEKAIEHDRTHDKDEA